jgi:hypothetical protein
MMISKGAISEGAVGLQPPPYPKKSKLKKTDSEDTVHQMFYVMYPAPEISHGNRLLVSKLEF